MSSVSRFNFSISASDLLELLEKQRHRYQDRLDVAVEAQDYEKAKDLISRLETLSGVLSVTPVAWTQSHLIIDFEVEEKPTPSLPKGMRL